MRAYLFIFTLLIVASFTVDTQAVFAQTVCTEVCDTTAGDECMSFQNECKKVGKVLPETIFGRNDDIKGHRYKCQLTGTDITKCPAVNQKSHTNPQTGLKRCGQCFGTVQSCLEYTTSCQMGGGTASSTKVGGATEFYCYVDAKTPNCPAGTGAVDAPVNTSSGNSAAGVGKFSPMVGIPGISGSNYTLPQLINALYKLLIMIGALIGVTKIAIAGVKYATTDVVSAKGDAKKDIQGVLTGLLILMAPYIILTIINPNFTNLNVLNLGSGATNTTSNNSGTFQGAPSSDKYTEQCSTTCTETNGASYKCAVFRNQCTAGAGQPDTKTVCAGNGPCEHVCKMVPGTNCPTFNLPTDGGGNGTPSTNQPKAPAGTFCFSCVAGVDADCPSKLQTACGGGEIFRPEANGPLYQCYMNGKSCPANPFITL